MAPPTPGAAPDSAPSDAGTHPAVGYALAPISGANYPDPQRLKVQLAAEFENALVELRRNRSRVCLPEDVHETIRRLYGVKDGARAFADAFKALDQRVDKVLAEELLEGVGPKAGASDPDEPARSMRIPYSNAIIRLFADYTISREVDLNQVITAYVMLKAAEWADVSLSPGADPQTFAVECITGVLSDLMAKTEPKVTGVEALAVRFGHRGDDQMAAVVRSAVSTPVRKFNKVKNEFRPDAA
jgi:hypothetical protein